MALVKFGAGIIQMSGSIAGTVHARNRFGNYIRPRTKPVNPRSNRQEAIRATMSFLTEFWHNNLDATQRGLWNTYAAAVAMKNRLGETIHLTGFNHFIRTNSQLVNVGGTTFEAAPSILSLPEKDTVLQCTEENIAAQIFTFVCDTNGWAIDGDTKKVMWIYQGQPQLASRNFFNGPWRYMGSFTPTEGEAGTQNLPVVYPIAAGQKVWFQASLMTISGRLSNRWTLDPRIVVADP